MSYFKINGSGLGIPDPSYSGDVVECFGRQGSTKIYSEYASGVLTWDTLSQSEYAILAQRILSLNGRRVPITLPPLYGGPITSWRTVWAHLDPPTASQDRYYPHRITVQVTHISTSED